MDTAKSEDRTEDKTPMPWCESCGSYHVIPYSWDHQFTQLKCRAPDPFFYIFVGGDEYLSDEPMTMKQLRVVHSTGVASLCEQMKAGETKDVEHHSYGQFTVSCGMLIAKGKSFLLVELKGMIQAVFTDDTYTPRDELHDYGFGWADQLGAWVRLGGPVGRQVAKALARSWQEAERAWAAEECPDPAADICESDEEHKALNEVVDEIKKLFTSTEGDGAFPLSEAIAENAHDTDVIEWIAKEVVPLEVGQVATYHGGASGDTSYTRVA